MFILLGGAVSRASGDRRILQVIRPRASSISSALWPASARRCVATGRVAQQRRSFILRGMRWSSVNRYIMQRVHFLYPLLMIVLPIGGIILAALVLQYWMILLTLAAAWSVMVMIMTRLLFNKIYSATVVRWRQDQHSNVRALHLPTRFPVTPMPATPLIRVLETIDLSRANMENFMDDTGEPQTAPDVPAQEQNRCTNRVDTHQIP